MEQHARTTARTTAAHANFAIHYSWSPFEQSYHHRLSLIPTTRPRASPLGAHPPFFGPSPHARTVYFTYTYTLRLYSVNVRVVVYT